MRYQSPVCSGLGRYGVNMLINLRYTMHLHLLINFIYVPNWQIIHPGNFHDVCYFLNLSVKPMTDCCG
jgi:hypothetical protein